MHIYTNIYKHTYIYIHVLNDYSVLSLMSDVVGIQEKKVCL